MVISAGVIGALHARVAVRHECVPVCACRVVLAHASERARCLPPTRARAACALRCLTLTRSRSPSLFFSRARPRAHADTGQEQGARGRANHRRAAAARGARAPRGRLQAAAPKDHRRRRASRVPVRQALAPDALFFLWDVYARTDARPVSGPRRGALTRAPTVAARSASSTRTRFARTASMSGPGSATRRGRRARRRWSGTAQARRARAR